MLVLVTIRVRSTVVYRPLKEEIHIDGLVVWMVESEEKIELSSR